VHLDTSPYFMQSSDSAVSARKLIGDTFIFDAWCHLGRVVRSNIMYKKTNLQPHSSECLAY
jgi:hypothetical protein